VGAAQTADEGRWSIADGGADLTGGMPARCSERGRPARKKVQGVVASAVRLLPGALPRETPQEVVHQSTQVVEGLAAGEGGDE
jgi:hypothetical protein